MIDGLVIILDLQTEEYYIFNEVASRLWVAFLNNKRSGSQVVDSIEEPDKNSIAFAKQCLDRGFLVPIRIEDEAIKDAISSPRRRGGRPNFLATKAWCSMVETVLRLRLHGFAATYLAYQALDGSYERRDQPALLRAAERAFLFAENFFLSHERDCLPRSLALFRFMRSLGLPVVHRIGGRRFPGFVMHAWVENADQPVLDDHCFAKEQTMIASIPQFAGILGTRQC